MSERDLVTYCGLYCDLCAERRRIPQQAAALRESMRQEDYELWAAELPGFREFWMFLASLCDREQTCPGCRQGGGPPFCTLRKCAQERKVETCPLCDDYPCQQIRAFAQAYTIILGDGQRMREIGLEAWIAEQRERACTGFVYADIRCRSAQGPSQ